jgi:hypothetical protein
MGLGKPLMKRLLKINVPKIQYIHTLFKPELCTYCGLKTLQTQAWQFYIPNKLGLPSSLPSSHQSAAFFIEKTMHHLSLWFRPGAIGRKSLTLKSYQ